MKKIISLFTALCIVFGVLGTFTVFADDTAADLEISTLAELEAFRDDVNSGNTYEGKTVKLTADIDMSEKYGEGKESWTPIGITDWENDINNIFLGAFDGDSHTIDGLYVYTDEECAALFNSVSGTIKSLNVKGSVSTTNGDGEVAGITVSNSGFIINCTFDGTVESPLYSAAGIAGSNGGVIENCKVRGKIEGAHNVGGISGYSSGEFTNCVNEAKVTGSILFGGIASTSHGSKFKNCINKGNVIGKTFKNTYTNWQGEEVTTVTESYAVGGIIGVTDTTSTIENCYNTGTVSGNTYVGGILGVVNNDNSSDESLTTVKNCYNYGKITSTFENNNEHDIGSVIGNIACDVFNNSENKNTAIGGEAINCYYLTGTADKGIAVAGEGGTDTTTALTAEQFANQSSFGNWDFDTVWEMDEALGRPVLRSNREAPPVLKYNIEYKDGSAVVTVPQEGAYTIIFASYKEGRLLSVNAQDKQFKKGRNEPIAPQNFNAEGNIKIMLWDSLEGMKPFAVTELLSDTFIQ